MIPVHLMREQNTREILVDCDLDVWVAFVIRKHGIIVRTVFLDQVAFQHQRFNFGFADDIFKPRDVADHFFDFR